MGRLAVISNIAHSFQADCDNLNAKDNLEPNKFHFGNKLWIRKDCDQECCTDLTEHQQDFLEQVPRQGVTEAPSEDTVDDGDYPDQKRSYLHLWKFPKQSKFVNKELESDSTDEEEERQKEKWDICRSLCMVWELHD